MPLMEKAINNIVDVIHNERREREQKRLETLNEITRLALILNPAIFKQAQQHREQAKKRQAEREEERAKLRAKAKQEYIKYYSENWLIILLDAIKKYNMRNYKRRQKNHNA